MSRIVSLLVLSALAIGLAATLWPRLRQRRWLTALVAFALFAVSGWLLPRLFGREVLDAAPLAGRLLKLAGAAWFVTCVLVILAAIPFLLLRGVERGVRGAVARLRRRGETADRVDQGRRRLLVTLGKGIPAAAALGSIAGIASGELPFRLKRVTVRLRELPAALDGFRIGQITDTHVGSFITPGDVARAVRVLDDEAVDLQVMTGDLCDDTEALPEIMAGLAACKARHGLLAIFGNHEHYRGVGHFTNAFRRAADAGAPTRLLVNESVLLHQGDAALRVVGVDYPFGARAQRAEQMESFADRGFAEARPDETVICLAHYPDFFPVAAARGARLTLAGHTHGGQVAIIGEAIAHLFLKYVRGSYLDGDSQLYVSSGTGHWLPFRIGVPAEVTVLTLRRV